MVEITIEGLTPVEAVEIVKKLIAEGLEQDLDFEWAYHKPVYDDIGYNLILERRTVFKFFKDETATWFALRYQ